MKRQINEGEKERERTRKRLGGIRTEASMDRYVYRQSWQPHYHTFPRRTQLNGSLYTHIAYRGHCSLQHASNIQSVFCSQDTHTHTHVPSDTLTHIFSQPLSHKCQYRKQRWHSSLSPSPSPAASVLLGKKGIVYRNC